MAVLEAIVRCKDCGNMGKLKEAMYVDYRMHGGAVDEIYRMCSKCNSENLSFDYTGSLVEYITLGLRRLYESRNTLEYCIALSGQAETETNPQKKKYLYYLAALWRCEVLYNTPRAKQQGIYNLITNLDINMIAVNLNARNKGYYIHGEVDITTYTIQLFDMLIRKSYELSFESYMRNSLQRNAGKPISKNMTDKNSPFYPWWCTFAYNARDWVKKYEDDLMQLRIERPAAKWGFKAVR